MIGRSRLLAAILVLLALTLASVPGSEAGTARKPFRVGLVLSSGLAQDTFWSGGLVKAVHRLGVEGKLLVPSAKEGYLPSFRSLARQRFDLVMTATESGVPAMEIAAREFPSVRFAVLDVHSLPPGSPKNVWGVGFAEEELGFLVGHLAARMEQRRPGKDVVSSVGGMKISQVDHFIAGFQAGARRADPGILTLNAYSRSWGDQAKCRSVALDQIAKGAGVVFDVAGYCGEGALEAAKRKGAWAIGVDQDYSSRGTYVLTSALKDGQEAVFKVIRATVEHRFGGGHLTVLGLRQGAVGLGKFSPRVPRSLKREVERIRRLIVEGKIRDIPTTVR